MIVVAVGVEADLCAGRHDLTEVDPEGGPAEGAVAQLQSVLTAVCGSRDLCVSIADALNAGIAHFSAGLLHAGKEGIVIFYLKANALKPIAHRLYNRCRGNCLEVVKVHSRFAIFVAVCLTDVVEQDQMVAILGQRNGLCLPAAASDPSNLIVLIGRNRMVLLGLTVGLEYDGLDILVAVPPLKPGVDIEGKHSTRRHSLTEIDSEVGPRECIVAQFHSILAAVFRRGDAQICIADPLDLGIVLLLVKGLAHAHKVADVAQGLKIQALVPVAHRFDDRLGSQSDHIINVYLCSGCLRGDLCPVIVPEQINMIHSLGQRYGQLFPSVTGELRCSLATELAVCNTELEDALIKVVGAAGDLGVCHEADPGALRQGLAKVDPEGGPVVGLVAQLQGIFAAAGKGGDIYISIADALNGCIVALGTFDLQALKVCGVALDLEVPALVDITLGLDGRHGIRGDHVIDVHLAVGFVAGKASTVVVPEQVNITGSGLQGEVHLCPGITLELRCGLSCAAAHRRAELENALIVQVFTLNYAIRHKGDLGSGGELLAEVYTEGGPVESIVAQLQGIFTAVFQGRNIQFRIFDKVDNGIAIGLALTGDDQLLSGGLEIKTVMEVEVHLFRFFTVCKVVTNQIIEIERVGQVFPALLMLHKFDGQITDACKVIDGEACHLHKIISAGSPAIGSKGVGLLDSGNIVAVCLTYGNAGLYVQFLICSIVDIKGNVLEL